MNRKYELSIRMALVVIVGCGLVLLLVGWVAAGGGYEILRSTIGAGGGISQSASGYSMTGSAGQTEAGSPMQGGGFTAGGGLLPDVSTPMYDLFLPTVFR